MKEVKIKNMLTFLVAMLVFSFSGSLTAQTLTFNAKKSKIVIKGDSNIHGWKTEVKEVPGQAVVDAGTKTLKSLTIDLAVTSLNSGDKAMDKKTCETFDSDKNPKINFKMTDVKNFKINADKSIEATITGNLSMAGSTKPVTLTAVGKSSGANSYVFTGKLPLKMTTFGMTPPKAMVFMKVKDDITLEYTITVDGISSSAL